MKKDLIKTGLVIIVTVVVIFVVTRDFFLDFASSQPLISSFIKFFLLASIGDFIGSRFRNKTWIIPSKIVNKAIL